MVGSKQSLDRDDLGDLDIWHPSEFLMRGCDGVGGWGDLQLSTVDVGGSGAKSIIGGEKNGNSRSFIHLFPPSSSSKPHTLLRSGPRLPSASATLKPFPAQLGPPLPHLLASLQHLCVRPYVRTSAAPHCACIPLVNF